ncbi:MAG: BlaI/MecI/CopY family transcriptional regulator [Oscillibacter sp.]|jgi:predicted transcriptional regulator|nr:BlaI/MecI/CopY family transcriptional regulator [Oscillibacter sp.]
MAYQLSDGEYKFMQIVWEFAPVPSPQLVGLCSERLGWKKSTTYTVLKRLCGKGIVRNENATVSVLAGREDVTASAADAFVEKTFGGSLPSFLTAFMSGKKLTETEAESLKRLIDAHQEE